MATNQSDINDLLAHREQYSYYARKLLMDLGLDDLKEPLRGQVLASMENYASQVLTNTILESLDDATIDAIGEMTEKGSKQDEVMTYLVASTPGLEQKIAQALADTYQQLRQDTQFLTREAVDYFKKRNPTESAQPMTEKQPEPTPEPTLASDSTPADQPTDNPPFPWEEEAPVTATADTDAKQPTWEPPAPANRSEKADDYDDPIEAPFPWEKSNQDDQDSNH